MGGPRTGDLRLSTVDSVLEDARGRGFLGPAAIAQHRKHTQRFMVVAAPGAALDLGSGGGVPGLLLAEVWSGTAFVLLDADRRRASFLDRAVIDLGWAERVRVIHGRAEEEGRRPELRGRFDFVSARSFGPPAVVAECGAPFLRVGGVLVVSDPPGGPAGRWPADGLAKLGLTGEAGSGVTVLHQETRCPDKYPRRAGVPARRPLFETP